MNVRSCSACGGDHKGIETVPTRGFVSGVEVVAMFACPVEGIPGYILETDPGPIPTQPQTDEPRPPGAL